MKKLLTLSLLLILAISTACTQTDTISTSQETNTTELKTEALTEEATTDSPQPLSTQQPQSDPYETAGMPNPFNTRDAGGGSLAWSLFTMPCSEGPWDRRIDGIAHHYIDVFVGNEEDGGWFAERMENLRERPATSLMDYPNLYSFIKAFNVPIDELEAILKEDQSIGIRNGFSETNYFTDEEIALIVSLDEAAIMEHFVSDYTLYHNGKVFTPMWFYLHTPDDYRAEGITLEMVEDKLSWFANIPIQREAVVAFEEKLSAFVGDEVSFDEIRATAAIDWD